MKASDRTIVIGLGILAVIGAFVVMVLMPKRNEASSLADQVSQARSEAETAEQQVAFASQARESFPSNYSRLVTLGKAVPSDDDTSSLLVQLSGIADRAKVDFRGIELADTPASAPPPAPPAPASGSEGDKGSDSGSGGGEGEAQAQPVSATPTEAGAAGLPLGATVGSAGLPVMPYKLSFVGNFSRISKFIDGIQRLVDPGTGKVNVRGRLITIDGFSLTRDEKEGFPNLKVSFIVTTYVTPQAQGLTAGATPTGPGLAEAAGSPSSTPVSNQGTTP